MSSPQLSTPLEYNINTGEPFLRLEKHPRIIITPPRMSDADALVRILNDERVCMWLSAPPFPYTPGDADWWLRHTMTQTNEALAQLEKGDGSVLCEHAPIRCIREIQDDGSDVFLGDIDIIRCPWMDVYPSSGREPDFDSLLRENNSRTLGDPEIVWTVGYYLSSSHHGLGIMPDAFGTLLHNWAVSRMGVRRMVGTAFGGNVGSVRVFEKNGFAFRTILKDARESRGKTWDLHVLDWNL